MPRSAFCAALTVLFWALAACHKISPPGQTEKLRRALAGEPATLDPGSAADTFSSSVLIDLYEGLTSETASGDIVPGVASSWSLDPSGTVYTFELRPNAYWSNGKKVKSQDFVTAWRRVIDPKFGSPAADDLRLITHAPAIRAGKESPNQLGVIATSDSILTVMLGRPAAYFPQILAHPSTFPIYSPGSATTHLPAQWVSNGPYTLTAWQPTTGMDLKANPYYWDHEHVRIKELRYQFITSEAHQYDGYRAGEIDLTDSVPANALPSIRSERPSELVIAPFLATSYLGINLANKIFSSEALRQSLAMAIDRKRLVEMLGFGQVPAYGFVPPGTAHYTPQTWSWKNLSDEERKAAAKKLYEKAGFSSIKPLHLRILLSNNEGIRKTAVLTAAMWREVLGIQVELVVEEYKVFLQTRHDTSRWEVARLAWTADYNDASNFLDVLRTHSPNNDMNYSNDSMDAELDQAAVITDDDMRREHLQSAERLILDDYPIIPLYYFVSKRMVKPYIRGFQPNPLNHVPSKGLSFDR